MIKFMMTMWERILKREIRLNFNDIFHYKIKRRRKNEIIPFKVVVKLRLQIQMNFP
jgi:hypothetical protein